MLYVSLSELSLVPTESKEASLSYKKKDFVS